MPVGSYHHRGIATALAGDAWIRPKKLKWRGVPVWEHDGIICTGEIYKEKIKLTFARGASLEDPSDLFNSSLEGKVRRAVDIQKGEEIEEAALAALIQAAADLNASKG